MDDSKRELRQTIWTHAVIF